MSIRIPAVGSVWLDNYYSGPHQPYRRYVIVLGVEADGQRVRIRACAEDGSQLPGRSRPTTVTTTFRFGTTARSGFTFVSSPSYEKTRP